MSDERRIVDNEQFAQIQAQLDAELAEFDGSELDEADDSFVAAPPDIPTELPSEANIDDHTIESPTQVGGMNAFINVFVDMTPSERVSVISAVSAWFCTTCGEEYPWCKCSPRASIPPTAGAAG